MVDDEATVIEDLIGIAFVIAQTTISNVVSSLIRLHNSHKKKTNGVDLNTTDGTENGIRNKCSNIIVGTQFSEVQVINAFANYYKHNSEWSIDWTKPKNSKKTAEIIRSVGASSGSTGNFRRATEVLQFKDYSNVLRLLNILKDWRLALEKSYIAELQVIGAL